MVPWLIAVCGAALLRRCDCAHGTCTSTNGCECLEGWSGARCDARDADVLVAQVEQVERSLQQVLKPPPKRVKRITRAAAPAPAPRANATKAAPKPRPKPPPVLHGSGFGALPELLAPAPAPPPLALVSSVLPKSWGVGVLAPRQDDEDAISALGAKMALVAQRNATNASNNTPASNITQENIAYDDEFAPMMHAADDANTIWQQVQKERMDAVCGGCEHGVCNHETTRCECERLWHGDHCDTHQPETACGDCNYGHCWQAQCVCEVGWGGEHCDEEGCEMDCHGQGVCLHGQCVCNDQFVGPTCGQKRCPYDCHHHGDCTEGVCECHEGYGGPTCQAVTQEVFDTATAAVVQDAPAHNVGGLMAVIKRMPVPTCPEECSHQGKCVDNACNCYTGYTGDACENFCPNFCSHQGECIEGACLCVAGFIGVDCSVKACCNGHGDCSVPDTCICEKGWMGPACGIPVPCFDGMCSGHGKCDPTACTCDGGWSGDDCATPPKECGDCGPHGNCNRMQKRCECTDGFSGPKCNRPPGADAAADEEGAGAGKKKGNNMRGGKRKVKDLQDNNMDPAMQEIMDVGPQGDPAAVAAAKEAAKVEEQEQEREKLICGDGQACSGHGDCNVTMGVCECHESWDGPYCDYQHCAGYDGEKGIEDCNGNGMCVQGQCYCMPGWSSNHTEEQACSGRVCEHSTSCSDHGACVDGACVCDGGWAGVTCHEAQCPGAVDNPCTGHGTCSFFSGSDSPGECECFPGFESGDCSVQSKHLPECPNQCSANGLCFNGRCVCSDGFRGPDCSEPVCADRERLGPECNLPRCVNDCSGQGLCFGGVCECSEDFYGDDCGMPRVCYEGCQQLCMHDSKVPACATCLGHCETLVAGKRVGQHNWYADLSDR